MSSNKYGLKCVIPEGVRNISDGLFDGVTNITGIQLPSTLKRIGHEAFSYTSIQSVTIPEGVASIEGCCFRGCVSLTSVTLPPTLKLINEKAFYRTSVREVVVMGGIKKYWCKVPLFIKNILESKGIECPLSYCDEEDKRRRPIEKFQLTKYKWKITTNVMVVVGKYFQSNDDFINKNHGV